LKPLQNINQGDLAMKRLVATLLLVSCLPFVGCNDQKTTPIPPTSPDKRQVDVHAPGVDVKSDKEGTVVHTPGADVDVNRK
jgi:hypothetical protein